MKYRYCQTPSTIECDGLNHYYAVWDEDINRWVPVDGLCPHRDHNRHVLAEEG